jgi:hypothetical protein
MNVFDLRDRLVGDYASYTRSFIKIADPRISHTVESALNAGEFWPEPLLQLNPTFLSGGTEELKKFLEKGYPEGKPPVLFHRYTGQERGAEREAIRSNPPDILLTNYMMPELLLTRSEDRELVRAAQGLRFLVFDELHTYRGRQGADVALLIRRCRQAFGGHEIICIGTSATMASGGTGEEQKHEVAKVAETLFGVPFDAGQVVGETLERATLAADLEDH